MAGAVSEEERLQKALDLAYAYVNPRDRTVSEVHQRLQRRGVSEELTERAVQILADQGFLDDARFARLFVADKRALEQWGSERIRRGLLARGIDRHLVEEALAVETAPGVADASGAVETAPGAADASRAPDASRATNAAGAADDEPESELARALALLRRRFPDPPEDRRDRNRALGMLMRKGYESELALDALAAYARGD